MTIAPALPYTIAEKERSDLFVRFIEFLFAVVIGQSFLFLSSQAGVFSWVTNPLRNILTLGNAILAYSLVVTSWIGYHDSTKKLPMKNVGRFVIDIFLLFLYSLTFASLNSFSTISLILFAVFLLYFAWTIIRLYEYYQVRGEYHLIKRSIQAGVFAIAFFIVALLVVFYPDPTLQGVMLDVSFLLLILYRLLYWGGPKKQNRFEQTRRDGKPLDRMKIYVAGPYTPSGNDSHDAARIAHQNTLRAIKSGIEVIRKGHVPFIPHLTHYIHLETDDPLPAEFYYEYDMVWLRYCDALLYLGESRGADRELKWAQEEGLKIFHSIDEIPQGSTWASLVDTNKPDSIRR